MSAAIEPLRRWLRGHLGWELSAEVQGRLAAAVQASKLAPSPLLARVVASPEGPAARRLIESLVVGESYFFRHLAQLESLIGALQARARAGRRRLEVLSAGCSRGQEAYSLRMLWARLPEAAKCELHVLGLDVSHAAIEYAQAADFAPWSLRRVDGPTRRRFFEERDGLFRVAESVRAGVRFEQRNLLGADAKFWSRPRFDAIICRNVLMYFDAAAGARVIDRFATALRGAGVLVLGSAEGIRAGEVFVRGSGATALLHHPRGSEPAVEAPAPAPRKRNRISVRPRSVRERVKSIRTRRPDSVEWAVARVRQGHGDETLDRYLRRLANKPNAEAHYVVALCYADKDDPERAIEHHRAAIQLEPGFAFPHLHLGVLAARSGEVVAAREHLWRALELFDSESEFRLERLSGGYGRAGVIAACWAQLRLTGGEP